MRKIVTIQSYKPFLDMGQVNDKFNMIAMPSYDSEVILEDIAEGQQVIDNVNNRISIKKDGKLYKQVVSGTDIILEEI